MLRPLAERLRDVPQVGRLDWIGIRPARGVPVDVRDAGELVAGQGLVGDRAAKGKGGGKRQVTLVQAEHLPLIGAWLGRAVELRELRRNLGVTGINLLALVNQRFAIGETILVGTGACHPCAKMDELVGPGAFQAMRGHGGITAAVERGVPIRIGDAIQVL
jgi:MOSC domain-containing protein YiiM